MAIWKPLQQNTTRVEHPFGDDHAIRFAYEPDQDRVRWVDFAVYEIVGRHDGRPLFELPDAVTPMIDSTENIDEAEPLLHGFVKWDGCTQWWYERECHVDDVTGLNALHAAIAEARRYATVEIIKDAADMSEYGQSGGGR